MKFRGYAATGWRSVCSPELLCHECYLMGLMRLVEHTAFLLVAPYDLRNRRKPSPPGKIVATTWCYCLIGGIKAKFNRIVICHNEDLVLDLCWHAASVAPNQVAEATNKYKMCLESGRQSVFGGLTNELQSCSEVSDYDLTGGALPMGSQRLSFLEARSPLKTQSPASSQCSIVEPQEVPETPAPAESTSSGSSDTTSTVTPTMSVSVSGSGSGSELDIEDQDIQKSMTEPASKDLNIQDEAESPTRTPASTRVSATGTASAISSAGIALVTITAYAMD